MIIHSFFSDKIKKAVGKWLIQSKSVFTVLYKYSVFLKRVHPLLLSYIALSHFL